MSAGGGGPGNDAGDAGLMESAMHSDPLVQFADWFRRAARSGVAVPEAMALATADAAGRPTVRFVLLKGYDERGFVFYTHTVSLKGAQLAENPRAALALYWQPLNRQVRIEGEVEGVGADEADAYFAARPVGSRISACVAPQSSVVDSREYLERRFAEIEARFRDGRVPRPSTWSGYRVRPVSIEFWQSRDNRLHDRIRYRRRADGSWARERLAP